jgi:hypothetical protein
LVSLALQRREHNIVTNEVLAAVGALVTCIWIVASSGGAVVAWGTLLLAAGCQSIDGWRHDAEPPLEPLARCILPSERGGIFWYLYAAFACADKPAQKVLPRPQCTKMLHTIDGRLMRSGAGRLSEPIGAVELIGSASAVA